MRDVLLNFLGTHVGRSSSRGMLCALPVGHSQGILRYSLPGLLQLQLVSQGGRTLAATQLCQLLCRVDGTCLLRQCGTRRCESIVSDRSRYICRYYAKREIPI